MLGAMLIQKVLSAALCAATLLGLSACSTVQPSAALSQPETGAGGDTVYYTVNTKISDVTGDSAFGN